MGVLELRDLRGVLELEIQSYTSTNGHLSSTATFLADSRYNDSCLNFSTAAICL